MMALPTLSTSTTITLEEFVISSTTVVTPPLLEKHGFPFLNGFDFCTVAAVVFVRAAKETTYLLRSLVLRTEKFTFVGFTIMCFMSIEY